MMKRIVLSVCAAVAAAVVANAASTLDYVQDGLVALYDGIDNSLVDGVPTHRPDATKWDDLTGNGTSFTNRVGNTFVFGDTFVTLEGVSTTATNTALSAEIQGRTLEVFGCVTKLKSAGSSAIRIADMGLGYIYHQLGSDLRLCAEFFDYVKDASASAAKGNFHYHQGGSRWTESEWKNPSTYSLVSDPDMALGESLGALYVDGGTRSLVTGSGHDRENRQLIRLGPGDAVADGNAFRYYSVRVYNRPLTLAEREHNRRIDQLRFVQGNVSHVVRVSGVPCNQGWVTPTYDGNALALSAGEAAHCSARASALGRTNLTLLGYAVYTNGNRTAGSEYKTGTEPEFDFVQPVGATSEIVWKWSAVEDATLPLVSDVTAEPGRAAVKVCGRLSGFSAAATSTLRVLTSADPLGKPIVWEGLAGSEMTSSGGYFTLSVPADGISPNAISFGHRYELFVEADTGGKLTRSAAVRLDLTKVRTALYEQNGLAALWDGIDNSLVDGVPTHRPDATKWDDLTGNGTSFTNRVGKNTFVFGDTFVTLEGVSNASTNSVLPTKVQGRTMEVFGRITKLQSNGLSAITLADMGQGYVYHQVNGNLRLCAHFYERSDGHFHWHQGTSGWNDWWVLRKYSLVSDPESLLGTDSGTLYVDDQKASLGNAGGTEDNVSLWRIFLGSANTGNAFKYYSVRVYSRAITESERTHNAKVDRVRFAGASVEDVFGDGWRITPDGEAADCRIRLDSPLVALGTNGTDAAMTTGTLWVARTAPLTISAEPVAGRRIAWRVSLPTAKFPSDNQSVVIPAVTGPFDVATLDAFMPSASVIHVAPGATFERSSLAGIDSLHVGALSNETGTATCRLSGQVEVTAANGSYAIVTTMTSKTVKGAVFTLLNGGKMKLLADATITDLELPDAADRLDLNGHTLTIRSMKHRDKVGWPEGCVVDSSAGRTGKVVWRSSGFMLMVF